MLCLNEKIQQIESTKGYKIRDTFSLLKYAHIEGHQFQVKREVCTHAHHPFITKLYYKKLHENNMYTKEETDSSHHGTPTSQQSFFR